MRHYKSYLPLVHRSIFEKQYVFQVRTRTSLVLTPWYTITKPFWQAEGGVVARFVYNAPAFYVVTPARLAELLALAEEAGASGKRCRSAMIRIRNRKPLPLLYPWGKFAMYPDWQPDADFIRMAALWGVALREPVTTEELASFIAYWAAGR